MFVIPDENQESTFDTVRVPYNQANFCNNVVEQKGAEDSPRVHIVRPKKAEQAQQVTFDAPIPMEEEGASAAYTNSAMETDSAFTYFTDYDEDLDDEFFFHEKMDPKDWDMTDVKMEFRWMKVDPANVTEGESPFFDLP